MHKRWIVLLVFASSLLLYVITLPRGLLPGDSGELIAASHTLSISHPPGYPLYTLVGNLFSRIVPFGSLAWRYNLLSAVAVSAMMALIWLMLAQLGISKAVATAVTLAVATLSSTWLQATTAEVYGFNGFLATSLLLVPLLHRRLGWRIWLLIGYLGGLSMSHHLTLIYPLAVSAVLALRMKGKPDSRCAILAVLMFILGLAMWLYIPVRSSLEPPLVWGKTHTVGGFFAHISAQGYRWRLRAFSPLARVRDFLEFFKLCLSEFGIPLCLIAAWGAFSGLRRTPALTGAFVALLILFAGHFAMYNIPDISSHIFTSLISIGVLAGIGVHEAARWFLLRRSNLVASLAVSAILIHNLIGIEPRSDEWLADDYARAICESAISACGKDCLIITSGDLSTFPILYLALTQDAQVKIYDLGASNPEIIGQQERPPSLEACAAHATRFYGSHKVAFVGLMPSRLLGKQPRICGMVSIIDKPVGTCLQPTQLKIRGLGAESRDYSSRLLSASYYLHLARWYLQQGDTLSFDEAITKATSVAYDDVGTFINAASLCLAIGKLGEALSIAYKAINVDPDFFEAHDLLANILVSTGRVNEAISEYKLALRGNPSPAMVHSNLANAYASRGDYELALEHFSRALSLDSTLINAHIGMGRVYEATHRYDDAIRSYRAARSLDPSSVNAYHAEATLYLALERYDDAVALLRKGLKTSPGEALLLADLGVIFLRRDRPDSAIFYLEQAVRKDASLLTAHGNLAVAYERMGLRQKAIAEYRAYVEMAPPGRLRQKAQDALKRLGG